MGRQDTYTCKASLMGQAQFHSGQKNRLDCLNSFNSKRPIWIPFWGNLGNYTANILYFENCAVFFSLNYTFLM